MIDTRASFIAGYVVATAIYAGYLLTLWWRAQRVRERVRKAGKA